MILAAPIMSKLDQQYAESPSDKCRETDDQYNVSSQTVTSPLSLWTHFLSDLATLSVHRVQNILSTPNLRGNVI